MVVDGGYVDVLFTCGECGFIPLESWSCSKYVGLFQGSEMSAG